MNGGKPGDESRQDTQDGTRLVPRNEPRDVKQNTTMPLFRSYQFLIMTAVMFLAGLLVPFQLFLRYRNVILKFTIFDWITFVAFLVLPFFVVVHQREHVVQVLLVAFSGLAITSLLAYMYVPVLEFA
ncbi:hypothetical protein GF325_01945, partial [Candidatus Bathyarchaeota archaeon]|nr:hypothetical protein [Candidatus Bathyarchaeota archaeon]